MTALRIRNLLFVQLFACSLLGACGNVKLQSFDRMADEVSRATYHGDRQACARHTDSTVFRECMRRTDEAYEAWRVERDKTDNR